MKALALTFALLLLCSGAALAQTPDDETPAEETVCDNENGAAFGLCNAYCEAMDCDSESPQASATACTKVRDKFMNIADHDLPCEAPVDCPTPPPGTTCPCVDAFPPDFADLLDASGTCFDNETHITKFTEGVLFASCGSAIGTVCRISSIHYSNQSLDITPEEASACVQLIRASCGPAGIN